MYDTSLADVLLTEEQAEAAAAVLFGYHYRCTVRYGETVLTSDEGGPDLWLGYSRGRCYVAHHAPGLPCNATLHSQMVEIVRRNEERMAA